MKPRLHAVGLALASLWWQCWLLLDQACNAIVLGVAAVFTAAWTGEEQATCYADETLSAHAWRAGAARKPWARFFRPIVDRMFFWQRTEPRVDAKAGFAVTGHCERAFWKKRLRLGLPREYQED